MFADILLLLRIHCPLDQAISLVVYLHIFFVWSKTRKNNKRLTFSREQSIWMFSLFVLVAEKRLILSNLANMQFSNDKITIMLFQFTTVKASLADKLYIKLWANPIVSWCQNMLILFYDSNLNLKISFYIMAYNQCHLKTQNRWFQCHITV